MDGTQDLDLGPRAGRRSFSRTSTASSTTLGFPTPASSETSNAILDPRAGGRSLSRTSMASSTLVFPTPASSNTSGTNTSSARTPTPAAIPAGPLRVRSLSATSWRPQYPRIGQFAMTKSEEVVAAGPDGLVYFMRVQDHPSKPWSEPRPFPPTKAKLDSSTVTGLALHQEEKGALHVYCVANDKLHVFSRSGDSGSTFVEDRTARFEGSLVSGTPAVIRIKATYQDPIRCVIAPCRSGGLLYTSTRPAQVLCYDPSKQGWQRAKQVAAHLGIISAVSATVTKTEKTSDSGYSTGPVTDIIVAVCIASARLRSVEGPFKRASKGPLLENIWQGEKSIKIQHPGGVTGNPVLLSSEKFGTMGYKLDLLVPSAEGGIFHYIRTAKSFDEWHMIGRISFAPGVPIASSLACARLGDETSARSRFRAHVQCGGRLYLIKTTEGASPWVDSQLYPINGPGPFLF